MDYLIYTVFKYIHILGAIAWIGGGVTIFFLGLSAMRQNDDEGALRVIGSVGFLANRWFVPASLITLVCGIGMATVGNMWGEAWIVLGLVGFAATFITGHFGLRPFAIKIKAAADAGDIPSAIAEGKRLLQVSKFDYTMLFMVVADMVFKPQWTDFVTLGVLATIIVAAAFVFLGGLVRPTLVAAE